MVCGGPHRPASGTVDATRRRKQVIPWLPPRRPSTSSFARWTCR
jgi:hypothetical protein